MDVDVLPHVEVVAVEVPTGQRSPLLREFSDRSPPAEILCILSCHKVFVCLLRRTGETVLERYTRDEEIVIGVGIALVTGHAGSLAGLPSG